MGVARMTESFEFSKRGTMKAIENRLSWMSTLTCAALVVGCTLETVPVGENDGDAAGGSGADGSVDVLPSDPDEGSGAAAPTELDPGKGGAGTGATEGYGGDPVFPGYGTGGADGTNTTGGTGTGAAEGYGGDPAYGTGATAGTGAAEGYGGSLGTGAVGGSDGESVTAHFVTAYCDMEASCIPTCMVEDGVVPCDTPERRFECEQIQIPYETPCEIAEAHWFECMIQSSCEEVAQFFSAHPDNIKPTTPCAMDFDQFCDDWEPPTEYAFN